MLKLGRNSLSLMCGLLLVGAASASANEPWREQALVVADRLAATIEVLDEALHEAYENHSTPEFKKAIEDMHHIEDVVTHLKADLPAAPFEGLCQLRQHLYEDLVQIRLDLIALGLQSNAKVVQTWNNMVNVFNNELNPFFQNCPPTWSGRGSNAVHTL